MKKRILHVLTDLPEKYNSKFVEFAIGRLTDFDHSFYAASVSGDVSALFCDSRAVFIEPSLGSGAKRFLALKKYLDSDDFDLVIIHGFFYGGWRLILLWVWFLTSRFPAKCLWMTWGGDTYYFQNGAKSLSGRVSQMLRKGLLRKVPFVAAATPQEEDVLRFYYTPNSRFFNICYPLPMLSKVGKAVSKKKIGKYNALVGNSADPSNNHEEMFALLGKAALPLDFYAPLAYGGQANAKKISELGARLFGDRFTAQMIMVPPAEYAEVLDTIDFGVFFHNRQQALGNILFLLSQGKPVFMRPDTLSYEYLKGKGWAVHSVQQLIDASSEMLEEIMLRAREPFLVESVVSHFSEAQSAVEWNKALWMMMARAPKV